MLVTKTLVKHKKRTCFFAYHTCSQESQLRTLTLAHQKQQSRYVVTPSRLFQLRPYSILSVQAPGGSTSENDLARRQTLSSGALSRQLIELGDIAL